jgi:hypothetical protein
MASNENRTAFLTMRGVLIWQLGRDLLALEIAKEQQKPAPDKISCRGRSASGYSGELSKIATHVVPTHSEQSNQSMLGLQADQPDPQEMDLDANEFLNQHHRLERLDAGCQIDLVAELEAEHGELGDAMDDEGGLQVKAGPYIEKLDFRCGTGSDDESSVDAGSEDRSALSGCSEHESNSESESEEASL